MRTMVVCALAAVLLESGGHAQVTSGQDFEDAAIGAEIVWFEPDSDFGWFSGGSVERPGDGIDAFYLLGGQQVYAGTELFYTSILDRYDPGERGHCCGYFTMEMRVSSTSGARIDFFGHGAGFHDDSAWPEALLHTIILAGSADQYLRWGDELQNSDITSIRWTSLDGLPIAIDEVRGIGPAAIPEPASWALLVTGFGAVGAATRRRHSSRRALA